MRRALVRASLVVFVLAMAVRLAFIALVPGWSLDEAPAGDPIDYHQIAASLEAGTGYAKPWNGGGPDAGVLRPTAIRPPLWPATLAAVYVVTGPDPAAGRLAGAVLDALTATLLVPLGASLVGPATGRLAGLLGAVYPGLWVNTSSLMSEAVFTFVVVLALVTAEWFRRRPTVAKAAALGLVLGLAALGRPNGIVLSAAMTTWVAGLLFRADRRLALMAGAACLNTTLLVVSPWVLWTGHRLGEPVPITTNGGPVLAGVYSSEMLDLDRPDWGGWNVFLVAPALHRAHDELSWDRDLQRVARDWITDHPAEAAKLVLYHVPRYFDLYWQLDNRAITGTPSGWRGVNMAVVLSWWAAAPMAVAGAVRLHRRHQLTAWGPGLVVFGALAVSGLLLVAATRFRAPAEPVVLLLAAAAVTLHRRPECPERRAT